MIKLYFNDGTEQVLNPSQAFFSHKEVETDYKSWRNGKRPVKTLTINERIAKIAADLGAIDFKLILD